MTARGGLLVASAILAGCATAPPPPPPARPPAPTPRPGEIEILSPPIEGFYGKRLADGAISILGHASVSDEAMRAARDRLDRMLAHAPRLRRNLEAAHHELHLVAMRQFTSDLPEHRGERGKHLETDELFDWHMIGGHLTGRFSSCTEATLLPIVGHRLFGEEVCVHELAHAIDRLALASRVRQRIHDAYRRSLDSGHWLGQYAARNEAEWFAEMTRYYFRPDGGELDFYNPDLARGRAWLHGEDAEAFQLVDDLYGDRVDPGTPRTLAVVLRPGAEEAASRSPRSSLPVLLTVRNRAAAPIHLVWIDFDGHRDTRRGLAEGQSAPPGGEILQATFAGHVFVVTDGDGKALCTVTAPDEDGAADVSGACR
jgi:hypothetical protein